MYACIVVAWIYIYIHGWMSLSVCINAYILNKIQILIEKISRDG